ncbi:hypothetical protein [Novosphingobium mangrovi (ex Huang et al. 2023)]|uniref:DUF4142 domain-containing protein n=1 Tax=Novosphingobium mangrovi (ex Huang et al. 2023) TaxID=2976432 RepID=A0ABT2I0E7_9SPHN|nr:hypothetical protein [Novosphingobium mangrovi (ex Huang et al. 2023)]MCT2398276.1 hypothetical protein [Novosphingobium mangrovi (ex Huang et al. 2023)]
MFRAKARLLPALLPMMAAACSTAGSYPSLGLRDFERIDGSATPVAGVAELPAPPLPPASADLVTRLDGLVAVARDADLQFQTNRPAAERAVAAAGGIASDSWSSASVALARLESSRSSAMEALADLDALYVDARTAAPLEETPSAKAIAAARDQVDGLVAAQDKVIEGLAARLPG